MVGPSHAGYEKQQKLLIWYFDMHLAKLVGEERWGVEHRYYLLAVSTTKEEVYGKKRTLVTAQSEAWGLMMLENCHDKWEAFWAAKTKDVSFVVPRHNKDPATHVHHKRKWSNPFAGQKKGWEDEVFTVLDNHSEEIKAFRKADHKKKWAHFNKVKKILREANGISAKAPIPVKNKKRSHQLITGQFLARLRIRTTDVRDWKETPVTMSHEV